MEKSHSMVMPDHEKKLHDFTSKLPLFPPRMIQMYELSCREASYSPRQDLLKFELTPANRPVYDSLMLLCRRVHQSGPKDIPSFTPEIIEGMVELTVASGNYHPASFGYAPRALASALLHLEELTTRQVEQVFSTHDPYFAHPSSDITRVRLMSLHPSSSAETWGHLLAFNSVPTTFWGSLQKDRSQAAQNLAHALSATGVDRQLVEIHMGQVCYRDKPLEDLNRLAAGYARLRVLGAPALEVLDRLLMDSVSTPFVAYMGAKTPYQTTDIVELVEATITLVS